MQRSRRRRQPAVVYALYLNAALLGGILLVLAGRGSMPSFLPAAYGAPQVQPIAGGGSIYLMPAQFSQSTWGCYVMDVDRQTLCAYQYFPNTGEKSLRFVAARHFTHDLKVKNYNTTPDPLEIKRNHDAEQNNLRGADEPQPAAQDPGPQPAPADGNLPPEPQPQPDQSPEAGPRPATPDDSAPADPPAATDPASDTAPPAEESPAAEE